MPKVGKKTFPYTKSGKKAAKAYAKKTGMMMKESDMMMKQKDMGKMTKKGGR